MFQMESSFKNTLLELKKQQWAKEREEASEEWSPWGRPGGGAPIRPIKTANPQVDRQPPQDKNNRTVLPPLPASGTNNGANNANVGGRVSATPRGVHHQPSSSRKSRHLKVSIGADVEGETSGYHSDNAAEEEKTAADHWRSASRSGRPSAGPKAADTYKMVERRKWVQEPPHSPIGGPSGYLGNYTNGNHLQAPEYLPQILRQRHMAPPRWVERSTSANIQLGHVSDGGGFYETHADDSVHPGLRATTTASSFLRGQNVPVDAWILAEREMKRRQAVELQRALLQQLAEKESKRQLERERIQEEERRQEEQLRRQLDQEKVHYEEEQKKIREKKEQEQKRLEAVHSAMLDAQQNAMAEKMAKRKQSSSCKEAAIAEPPTVNKLSVNVSGAPTPRVSLPIPMIRLVDAQIQTDSPPSDSNQACRCEKSHLKTDTRQGAADNSSSDRAVTDTSTGQHRHKSRSSLNSRPQWGSHQSSHKYMTNSEKDPRFLKKRRERLRRRQRAFLEKQLHGSWPSSESSGSREEIFFPFLPSAHSPVERYYEAHQAPVAHIMPSNSNYGSMKLPYPQAKKSVGRDDFHMEPLPPQTYRPATTTIAPPPPADRSASPPVPALLKKIRLANGESVTEKHEWEDYEEKEKNDGHKVSKDFENLKIRENQGEDGTTAADPDKEKQDLLFRLSLLKRGLEQRKTALDDQVSIISSTIP